MSSDGLVTVFSAASEFEARTVSSVLEEAGIDAVVFPTAISMLGFDLAAQALGGVPVQVRPEDEERARGALRLHRYIASSVDWDSVDVGDEDAEAVRLGKLGGNVRSFGRFMVRGGLIAAFGLIGLTVLMGVWRMLGP